MCEEKINFYKIKELLNFDYYFKMNKIIHNFSLTGDKLLSELHLKQQRFTCSGCGPFIKHRERIQKLEKQVI